MSKDCRTAGVEFKAGSGAMVGLVAGLFYAAVQSASGPPSSYFAVLAEDDDDGDLSNGTPNECLINRHFGRHGLRSLPVNLEADSTVPSSTVGHEVAIVLGGLLIQRDRFLAGAPPRNLERAVTGGQTCRAESTDRQPIRPCAAERRRLAVAFSYS